jgi:hypothetical protein
MEHTWATSRFKYVDADTLDDSRIDFDELEVHSPSGVRLGKVEGFIYDAATLRAQYIVVDSGGWFTSRQFLLPIGHAALDEDGRRLRTDIEKDAISRYPEFNPERFRSMSDADVSGFERRTIEACCAGDFEETTTIPGKPAGWRHYQEPSWWMARSQPSTGVSGTTRPLTGQQSSRTEVPRQTRTDREERVVARADSSPHFDGHAQPGDVIGIETGGERTSVGDTAEDENERREDAERAVEKDRTR